MKIRTLAAIFIIVGASILFGDLQGQSIVYRNYNTQEYYELGLQGSNPNWSKTRSRKSLSRI